MYTFLLIAAFSLLVFATVSIASIVFFKTFGLFAISFFILVVVVAGYLWYKRP